METKICGKCKIEKNICLFSKDKSRKDGYYISCKDCEKIRRKIYEEKNPNIKKERYLRYKETNYEKILKTNSNWRKNNPRYATERKKIDPTFKLIKNLRRRIKRFLDIKNVTKKNKTLEFVGCDSNFLKTYIENKFTEGMSWELMGKYIHIDHIIPLSSAKTEEELYKLCHYTNLQPLWAEDNLKKSDRLQ
jgi:hypothetical protein